MFDGNLKKWFFNTYKFSNHGINKFILLLWKVVYPYEYMNDWKNLVKLQCLKINMEDITDADYAHAKRVCKDFEIK